MPTDLTQAQYSTERLRLFPFYNSGEEYTKATGKVAPPWNPNKPMKNWEDPAAATSTQRYITYRAISYDERNIPETGPDGRPVIMQFSVPKADAGTVNLPPIVATVTADQVATQMPAPIRALNPDEELAFAGPGAVPVVRNTKLWAAAMSEQPGFGVEDRAILRAIAAKLGV